MKRYSSEAVVLSRKRYSEADRILILYSRRLGKISILAKGVRKPKSRKRGALEVFSLIKYSASKTRGMDIMTEVELVNSFPEIRRSLRRTSVAFYFLEVVGRLTHEGEQNEDLFLLLKSYLKKLKASKELKKLRKKFVYDCLVKLGFWPKGRIMNDPDRVLENVVEREISTVRVAKKILN